MNKKLQERIATYGEADHAFTLACLNAGRVYVKNGRPILNSPDPYHTTLVETDKALTKAEKGLLSEALAFYKRGFA